MLAVRYYFILQRRRSYGMSGDDFMKLTNLGARRGNGLGKIRVSLAIQQFATDFSMTRQVVIERSGRAARVAGNCFVHAFQKRVCKSADRGDNDDWRRPGR